MRIVRLPEGHLFHTAYRRAHWPALFNHSRVGNARFSPLSVAGTQVPILYGAATQTVALLESCFHDVHLLATRTISEPLDLATRGLIALAAPVSLPLIDLRNDALARLGLTRGQLVATTPEHYPCTREIAILVNGVAQVRRRFVVVEERTKIEKGKESKNRKKSR